MYHDQGLIPVKLLAFGRAVNVTLGLPIVRTSPDHGTAFDLAAVPRAALGQPAVLDLERITTAEGLSQDVVTSLLRDRDGFLWIGTEDGLNCYDGYEIRNFRHRKDDSTSLGHNWVVGLCEALNGDILVATMHGLYVYRKADDDFHPARGAFTYYATSMFRSPRVASDGSIWTIVGNGEILHVRPDGSLADLREIFPAGSRSLNALLIDDRGRVRSRTELEDIARRAGLDPVERAALAQRAPAADLALPPPAEGSAEAAARAALLASTISWAFSPS